ncbi:hypothetical protein [Hansschlegelia plantiphila]|uniref:Uncharacterized protein n=1 Tax=Hansschlegelia plantiphila TaxID=374655 RepID=A0A9W6IYG6_9HYPH|nr:hypothetical protein [Hansschlegelia plantiphila]GLK67027.1 hypothetical protein GCM10008179_06650 [Hansschlegelia plantiphila]
MRSFAALVAPLALAAALTASFEARAQNLDPRLEAAYRSRGMAGVLAMLNACYATASKAIPRVVDCANLDAAAYGLDRAAQASFRMPATPGFSRYETRERIVRAMRRSGAKPADIDPSLDVVARHVGGYALELR